MRTADITGGTLTGSFLGLCRTHCGGENVTVTTQNITYGVLTWGREGDLLSLAVECGTGCSSD